MGSSDAFSIAAGRYSHDSFRECQGVRSCPSEGLVRFRWRTYRNARSSSFSLWEVDAIRYASNMRVESRIFNGITFRRYPDSKRIADRNYFKPNARHIKNGVESLHREVWKAHHGPVPDGYHIHHRDENTGNNDISNLECILAFDHLSAHGKNHAPDLEHLARIRPLTVEWHRSEAGREWHRNHAQRVANERAQLPAETLQCGHCNKEFLWKPVSTRPLYCGNNCKSAARRKSRVDDVPRTCAFCGGSFMADKYSKTKFCGRPCAVRGRTHGVRDSN